MVGLLTDSKAQNGDDGETPILRGKDFQFHCHLLLFIQVEARISNTSRLKPVCVILSKCSKGSNPKWACSRTFKSLRIPWFYALKSVFLSSRTLIMNLRPMNPQLARDYTHTVNKSKTTENSFKFFRLSRILSLSSSSSYIHLNDLEPANSCWCNHFEWQRRRRRSPSIAVGIAIKTNCSLSLVSLLLFLSAVLQYSTNSIVCRLGT